LPGGIDRDLIVGPIPFLYPQVVVFGLQVDEGEDQFFLDERPEDPRHFIPVEFDQGGGHRDFLWHGCISLQRWVI